MLNLKNINSEWSIFLDRDGVINDEKLGEYILHWDFFIFSNGVLQAFKKLSDTFKKVIIVTNQKGVGKGLMTKEALDSIHFEMQREVEIVGGRIDRIYACIDLDDESPMRKPNHGMALQAKRDFPDIDLSKAIMVGNKLSDMQFGRNAGMYTVFIATTNPETPFPHQNIDLRFDSLLDFISSL